MYFHSSVLIFRFNFPLFFLIPLFYISLRGFVHYFPLFNVFPLFSADFWIEFSSLLADFQTKFFTPNPGVKPILGHWFKMCPYYILPQFPGHSDIHENHKFSPCFAPLGVSIRGSADSRAELPGGLAIP